MTAVLRATWRRAVLHERQRIGALVPVGGRPLARVLATMPRGERVVVQAAPAPKPSVRGWSVRSVKVSRGVALFEFRRVAA